MPTKEMVMKKTSAVMEGFTLWTCTILEYILLIMWLSSILIRRSN
uniref:Histone deacetylase, putative n=1 Tax=Arundo donax TaxID=35708 RepID=A0A0A9H2Z3_ARUDO